MLMNYRSAHSLLHLLFCLLFLAGTAENSRALITVHVNGGPGERVFQNAGGGSPATDAWFLLGTFPAAMQPTLATQNPASLLGSFIQFGSLRVRTVAGQPGSVAGSLDGDESTVGSMRIYAWVFLTSNGVAPAANFSNVTQTGLFTDATALTPAPGVVPYRINAGMWSDYASVDRVVGVPGNEAMATADGRETITGKMWYYPSNTVFARTLTLEMQRGQPASRRRIETQMLHFDGQGWNAYTYRWNPAQTDADLVPGEGASESFTVTDATAPGGRREIPWRFISRAECMRCHNNWADDTLSFNRLQLNTAGPVSELKRLEQLGVLELKPERSKDSPDPTFKPPARLADPNDVTAPVADRARSWLHANCAGCHRFGAGGGVAAQFNFDQPLALSRTVDVAPGRGDFGIVGARLIAPGDPFRSTLFYRLNTEGAGHMPHIGSRLVDEAGVRLVRDWIRSLPAATPAAPDAAAAHQLADDLAAALKQHDSVKLLATMSQLESLELGSPSLPDERLPVLKGFAFLKELKLIDRAKGYPQETKAKIKALLPAVELKFE